MQGCETAQALSTCYRRNSINAKLHPSSHSYLQRGDNDIYLNIEMPSIFSPPTQKSLKFFNRKLQQSLKEREMHQAMQQHDNQKANIIANPEVSPKGKSQFREKIPIIDAQDSSSAKELSRLLRRNRTGKKFSLQMKPKTPQKKSSFNIPCIVEQHYEQFSLLKKLITSESSKGLIQRLLKRKKQPQEGEQQQQPKNMFRYPFNRKIFNKGTKKFKDLKGSKLIISFNEANDSQEQRPSPIFPHRKFNFKQSTQYNNKNLLLSPFKLNKLRQNETQTSHKTIKEGKEPRNEENELGPWKQEGQTIFDI